MRLLRPRAKGNHFPLAGSDRVEIGNAKNGVLEPLKLRRTCLHHANQPHYLGTTSRRKADKLSPTPSATLVGSSSRSAAQAVGLPGVCPAYGTHGSAVLITLVDATELVIGANLSGASFHRGDELRAIFSFAHFAFCGVLGFDFGDTSLHTMFSHGLPSMHIGIGGLSGNPPVSLALGDAAGDELGKLLISDAIRNGHRVTCGPSSACIWAAWIQAW